MLSRADLLIYQGDDYAAIVTVLGGPEPPSLSGWTAQAQIRTGPADVAPVVIEITTEVVLPNLITMWIPAADTLCLSGEYVWDLQLIRPDGTITTVLAGNVIVTPEVTRTAATAASYLSGEEIVASASPGFRAVLVQERPA